MTTTGKEVQWAKPQRSGVLWRRHDEHGFVGQDTMGGPCTTAGEKLLLLYQCFCLFVYVLSMLLSFSFYFVILIYILDKILWVHPAQQLVNRLDHSTGGHGS